jgi:hypothetical protein
MVQSKKATKAKVPPKAAGKEKRTQVSAEALPRRTLQASLAVAQVIRDTYAGKSASWTEIADALGVSATSAPNRYPLWSAGAYGLVIKADENKYSLSDTGRKILAPTYEGEREEGVKKALFTPSVLSRFYTDYNGSLLPSEDLLPNVLETRYDVPRERTKEAIALLKENARYAGALNVRPDGKEELRFSDAAFPVGSRPGPTDGVGPESDVIADDQGNAAAAPATTKDEWAKICFVITPIGAEDSTERKHSDTILKHLLEPVLNDFKFKAIRADKISKPGIITKQVIEYIAYSRLCVADLSFSNPNAFYELGVRHAFKLSTIQIIRKGDKIPFDVSQGRTIIIDTSDPYTIMDRIEAARKELKEHVTAITAGTAMQEDNPINLFLPALKVSIP